MEGGCQFKVYVDDIIAQFKYIIKISIPASKPIIMPNFTNVCINYELDC